MAIQFPCSGCGNQLSVPDDAAGKKARCPQCSTVLDVPAQAAPGDLPGGEFHLRPPEPAPSPFPSAPGAAPQKPNPYAENPYASPTTGYEESKPVTFGSTDITPTRLDFEFAFSYTWELYKREMGVVIGAVLIVGAIEAVLGFIRYFVEIGLQHEDIGPLVSFGFGFVNWLINTFFGIGLTMILLSVARGRRADFGDLVAGGPMYLRILGSSILYGLMVLAGTALCIVPGIVLALMFGQYHMLIIDKDMGIMDAFAASKEITEGNKWTLLGVGIVAGLLGGVLTLVTCGIGAIFVGPFIALMSPVMYLKMAGQPMAKVAPS